MHLLSTSCIRFAAWLLFVVGFTCSEAAAQSIVLRKPALHWVRSDQALSCIDPRKLAEHVESLIGPVLVRPTEAEHIVEGRVDVAAPGLLRVRVRVSDTEGHIVGERELEQRADACSTITPAIVFVIGMTIDPEVAAHGLPPALVALLGRADAAREAELLAEVHPPPEPAPPPPEIVPRPVPVAPPVHTRTPVVLDPGQAALFAELAVGELSQPALMINGRVSYRLRGPLALAAYGRGGAQLSHHRVLQGQSLRESAIDAGILSCVDPALSSRVRIQACVGGEFALALARGTGFASGSGDRDDFGERAAFGLVAQLTARVRLTRQWGVGLFFSGRYTLPKRHFSVDNGPVSARTVVSHLHQLSAAVGLGPTFEF